MSESTRLPLSLYVHFPWCIRKCPYCDFNSHMLRGELPEEQYISALIRELQQRHPLIKDRTIRTIFLGGGTPSLFSASSLENFFKGCERYLFLNENIEITLEANPGTVEQTRFNDYRKLGINRLSLGLQSLNDKHLQLLGRIHNRTEAIKAVEVAKRAGFTNVNLDLMFGLPEQSQEEALHDLQQAIELDSSHLSWYQLTLEPNTYFYKHPPSLPEDDDIWEIQQLGQALLKQSGFGHYEVSAFSRKNQICRHNMNYWEFGDYLGIGAGAHSKITDAKGIVQRSCNVKNPRAYLNSVSSFIEEARIVSEKELPLEFMMNALRLQQPIPIELFEQRTRMSRYSIQPILTAAIKKRLMHVIHNHFVVTPRGKKFLNELLELFLPN